MECRNSNHILQCCVFIYVLKVLLTVLLSLSFYNQLDFYKQNPDCHRSRHCLRAGTRKQRKIPVHVTSRPRTHIPRHRPPSTLTQVAFDNNVMNDSNFSSLCVGHINARSVKNKTSDIEHIVMDRNIDMLFITETWLNEKGDESIIASLTPSGYSFKSFPRKNRRGGGVGVLMKTQYLHQILDIKEHNNSSFESFQVNVNINNQCHIFMCVYRPPRSKKNDHNISSFIRDFRNTINVWNHFKSKIVIVGDFNIHFNAPTSPEMKAMQVVLKEHELKQIINEPTNTHGNTIDWIVVPNDEKWIEDVSVIDDVISDHYVIMTRLKTTKFEPKRKSITSRNLKILKSDDFRNDLRK